MSIRRLFIALSAFLLGIVNADAQSVTVSDFHREEQDMTANLKGSTVYDRSGEKCALIKIETTKTGFSFDVGQAGVQDVKNKVGQIWVYVPHGVKHIILSHPKYAPCDYYFTEPIEKACTYTMSLIISEDLMTQRLTINYAPANATIILDGELLEGSNGSVSMELLQGIHSYNAVAHGYSSDAGSIVLSGGGAVNFNIDLSPSNKAIAAIDRYKPVEPLPQSTINSQQQEDDVQHEPREFTVEGVTFRMIPVQGGTFMMGATSEQEGSEDDEQPTHQVTLFDYFIGETEVTQALWKTVMGENPSKFTGDDLPVEMVSWEMCEAFISNLSNMTGTTFRLPTEAEWEYAARGGRKSMGNIYSGGNTLNDVGWGIDNSYSKTHEVKGKWANELGIYDMSGNVAEWCMDWNGSYTSTSQVRPMGPQSGQRRIIRGGSWDSYIDGDCRVSARNAGLPSKKSDSVGLRLVIE